MCVCACVCVCTLMRHYEPQTQISHNEPRTILPFVRTHVPSLDPMSHDLIQHKMSHELSKTE